MTIDDLQQTSSLNLESSEQGSVLNIENDRASARISLFGGHLLSFINKKDNRQRLWLSNKAVFDQQTPIRGGIPICWPWFGEASSLSPSNSPSHGYLRTQTWALDYVDEVLSNNKVIETHFTLVPSCLNAFGFDQQVAVRLSVKVSDILTIQLETSNLSENSICLSQALHTYLLVPNISNIILDGVNGSYTDKLTGALVQKSPLPYIINAEVDRIHMHDKVNKVIIRDKNTNEPLAQVTQRGHNNLVIWNPWIEKTARMLDMSKDGYKTMLCIEAANTDGIEIKANEKHTLEQMIY